MIDPVRICGLKVYPFVNMEQLCDFLVNRSTLLIAVGAEKLLSKDHNFRRIVNNGVGYADGIGTVWALKRKGYYVPKIRGADLWLRIIQRFNDRRFYIVGAEEAVLTTTLEKLTIQFRPEIVGARNGFLDKDGFVQLKEDIRNTKPDIVFVALGSPKQEFLMEELFKIHPALYMGIGGSLDLYAGKVSPVPEWWIKIFKWEGFYRHFHNLKKPKRWRRLLRLLRSLPIVWKVLTNTI